MNELYFKLNKHLIHFKKVLLKNLKKKEFNYFFLLTRLFPRRTVMVQD